jgi:putative transposase
VRKRKLNALEARKRHLVDELHWKTVNHLLTHNDVIFFGDIKSHGIVKGGKNRTLNTALNNLKFFQFKQKLAFKAVEKRKLVYMTKEHFTTKTCSTCGIRNDPGAAKVFYCGVCEKTVGRDVNAAKNILMKGILGC